MGAGKGREQTRGRQHPGDLCAPAVTDFLMSPFQKGETVKKMREEVSVCCPKCYPAQVRLARPQGCGVAPLCLSWAALVSGMRGKEEQSGTLHMQHPACWGHKLS